MIMKSIFGVFKSNVFKIYCFLELMFSKVEDLVVDVSELDGFWGVA